MILTEDRVLVNSRIHNRWLVAGWMFNVNYVVSRSESHRMGWFTLSLTVWEWDEWTGEKKEGGA